MKLRASLLFLFICSLLGASVKINEICYNPQGADHGKEWIELYNPTDRDINITNWLIVSGGSQYSLDYVFPYYILRAGRFVVVGGDAVPQAHFVHNFSFQNGGGATDGVRLISEDGNYTDTVVYDSPNINELMDDSGQPATNFAQNTPDGCSLARIMDGYDTNICSQDFIVESSPTPGMPNHVYADYSLSEAEMNPSGAGWQLVFRISNNSMLSPSQNALLKVFHEDEAVIIEEIEPIPARGFVIKDYYLELDWQVLWLNIDLEGDTNPENNTIYLSAEGTPGGGVVINEIMPMPLPRHQEWVEIYSRPGRNRSETYILKDASQSSVSFTLPPVAGYFVICKDKEMLLEDYPFCPPGNVIKVSRFPSLNDDGDELYLYNEDGTELLDFMEYSRDMIARDKALLRFEGDDEVIWKKGNANPGKANNYQVPSDPDIDPDQIERIKIIGSPASETEQIGISYAFDDADDLKISCSVFDLKGHKLRSLASGETHPNRGVIYWDGKNSNGRRTARGLYIILWESKSGKEKLYRRQLSVVIR